MPNFRNVSNTSDTEVQKFTNSNYAKAFEWRKTEEEKLIRPTNTKWLLFWQYIWINLDSFGPEWSHVNRFEAIWSNLELFSLFLFVLYFLLLLFAQYFLLFFLFLLIFLFLLFCEQNILVDTTYVNKTRFFVFKNLFLADIFFLQKICCESFFSPFSCETYFHVTILYNSFKQVTVKTVIRPSH